MVKNSIQVAKMSNYLSLKECGTNCKQALILSSLGSSTGSRQKVRVYRRNLYKIFVWVQVKNKKLGGRCHDLHMCPNSDIFKVADLYLGHLGE